MKKAVKPIPEGFNSITPYLSVRNADQALNFYRNAFGARVSGLLKMPDGKVGHAELQIGNSKIMLAEENEQWGNRSPLSVGGSPVTICLYVDNVDAVFDRALKEGARVKGDMVVKDQFYGDRTGTVIDPFGHEWSIMTHIEDVSFDEMKKRSDAIFASVSQSH